VRVILPFIYIACVGTAAACEPTIDTSIVQLRDGACEPTIDPLLIHIIVLRDNIKSHFQWICR